MPISERDSQQNASSQHLCFLWVRQFLNLLLKVKKIHPGGNGHPTIGGIGGRGGDVVIECAAKSSKKKEDPFKSLNDVFKKRFHGDPSKQRLVAGTGGNSHPLRVLGQMGDPVILEVHQGNKPV